MRNIYIATYVAGKGLHEINAFQGRVDFMAYADQVLGSCDEVIRSRDTIRDICDKLYDKGFGFGSRYHRRISRNERESNEQIMGF